MNPVVGDVEANARTCWSCAGAPVTLRADLVMFPELALCGYPPEDLLFHRGLRARRRGRAGAAGGSLDGMSVLVGYPEYEGEVIHNSAILLRPDGPPVIYRKQNAAELRRVRREALFQPGPMPCARRLSRHQARHHDLRGHLGRRTWSSASRSRRRMLLVDQRLALTRSAKDAARLVLVRARIKPKPACRWST
jgi:hypothetical protein